MSSLESKSIDYEHEHEHPQGETYTTRMRNASRIVTHGIIALILFYLVLLMADVLPKQHTENHDKAGDHHAATVDEHESEAVHQAGEAEHRR